ncbi:MAG: PspC domain-containing protein [Prolixibacteraceae bacterium]|jgi:phage shock protein C|nr:PspC domain-containing protein [Prolixibacteraceae bacterium]
MKRLRRSNNKVIAGVCAGVANYLNPEIDPVAVRVATVLLSFIIPVLPMVYLILALVIPSEENF